MPRPANSPVSEARLVAVYTETIDALYGYVSRRCGGSRELAEDVTQEAWLRAVRTWPERGIPDAPLAWLTTVARNLLFNHARRRESVSLDTVSPAEVLDAVDRGTTSDSAEVAELVGHALTRLPRDQARLLEAFHYDRARTAQLAETYGVSERAIEGRLRRARERLRTELEISMGIQGGNT